MEIRKDRWHYYLYLYYFSLFANEETLVPGADFCTMCGGRQSDFSK